MVKMPLNEDDYKRLYTELSTCMLKFRQDLRQLLYEYDVRSNPGWTEDDIVRAFRVLLQERR